MNTCTICNKSFSTYRGLNGHMRTHGPSRGLLEKRRVKKKKCLCCNKTLENNKKTYCNKECFNIYRWEKIDKPRVLNGNGAIQTIKRFLKEEFGSNCVECGQGEIHNGKELTLQLDHIDGNSDNNNIENVRLLCPNCHTQTDTYGSKGNGNRYKKHNKRNTYLRNYKGLVPDGKASGLHSDID